MAQFDERPARVESLTGLRWFAAFFVFIHHAANLAPIRWITVWSWLGVSGVTFFFVLSGFVLTWSWFPKDRAGRFYWRRFARIYPLHFVTTLLAIPIFYGSVQSFQKPMNIGAIALTLALLHAWIGTTTYYFGGNPASWSLSDETFFYAIFPKAIRRICRSTTGQALQLALVALLVMWLVLVLVNTVHLPHLISVLLIHSPLYRALQFVLGICVGVAVRVGWRPRIGFWPAVGLLGLGLLSLAIWARVPSLQKIIPGTSIMDQVTAPLYALVIATAAVRDIAGRPSFLRRPWLVTLGHWSYAFYLTHATVLYGLRLLNGGVMKQGIVINAAATLGALGISIALAGVLYRFLEHPVEGKLRGMLPPLDPTAASYSAIRPK